MKIAFVHDWLYVYGGAERVLSSMIKCFPSDEVDIFCLFDTLSERDKAKIGYERSNTSFLQKMPQIHKRHRLYLPIMPLAIEQFDLSGYDLVISSSYCVAKGVITGPDQLHISYIHSPMRYAWDLQHQYLRESNKDKGLTGVVARVLLHKMRLWDVRTAYGPNAIVANSHFVARRIEKIYGRKAEVIYPPVSVPSMPPDILEKKGDYFLVASRLVQYKNVHLVVQAFRDLPSQKLLVAGDGPELNRIKAIASNNVEFLGFISDVELRDRMRRARAFVFAAEEDFGIVPVEAQANGTPVIALGRGGLRETVITTGKTRTGLFFDRATPQDISNAVRRFIANEGCYNALDCYKNALRFSETTFITSFESFVRNQLVLFNSNLQKTWAQPLTEMVN